MNSKKETSLSLVNTFIPKSQLKEEKSEFYSEMSKIESKLKKADSEIQKRKAKRDFKDVSTDSVGRD